MALIRQEFNKRLDWDIVVQEVSRDDAMKAAVKHLELHNISYRFGYKFDDGTQQIYYVNGYDGSAILGKIIPQSDDRDDIHAVPW
jgi:hypothetical protein